MNEMLASIADAALATQPSQPVMEMPCKSELDSLVETQLY